MKRYIFLILLAGCAETAYYVPTDNNSARSPSGLPAAQYEIRDSSGRVAEVNVWSRGVAKADNHSVVHATIEVRNVTANPVDLNPDLIRADAFADKSRPLPPLRLQSIAPAQGQGLTVPGNSARDFDVWLATDPGISPGDLKAFRLQWGVEQAGRQYVQYTQFARVVPENYNYGYYNYAYYGGPYYGWGWPYAGWYDPFFWNPTFGPPMVTVEQQASVKPQVVNPSATRVR